MVRDLSEVPWSADQTGWRDDVRKVQPLTEGKTRVTGVNGAVIGDHFSWRVPSECAVLRGATRGVSSGSLGMTESDIQRPERRRELSAGEGPDRPSRTRRLRPRDIR